MAIIEHLRRWTRELVLAVWIPVCLLLAFGFVLSMLSNAAVRKSRDLVVHSYQVLGAGKDVLLALDDAETGQRGYLLTGSQEYLDPYRAGRARAAAALDRLDELVKDNPAQVARAAHMRQKTDEKMRELGDVIGIRERAGFDAARNMVLSNAGKATMDALRASLADMQSAEDVILAARDAEVARNERSAFIAGAVVAALSVLSRIVLAKFGRRQVP